MCHWIFGPRLRISLELHYYNLQLPGRVGFGTKAGEALPISDDDSAETDVDRCAQEGWRYGKADEITEDRQWISYNMQKEEKARISHVAYMRKGFCANGLLFIMMRPTYPTTSSTSPPDIPTRNVQVCHRTAIPICRRRRTAKIVPKREFPASVGK